MAVDGSPFVGLKNNHYGLIYCDPPWKFKVWDEDTGNGRSPSSHYETQDIEWLCKLPVIDLAADDCMLIMWICWPTLKDAIRLIEAWGFEYKTCAFSWMKAWVNQTNLFRDDADAYMGMGYYTRSNSEVALLATRGKPKRHSKGVRQGIIEPIREHSRKPDCVYDRIERLVGDVPKCELFARTGRPGWDSWGNETNKFR